MRMFPGEGPGGGRRQETVGIVEAVADGQPLAKVAKGAGGQRARPSFGCGQIDKGGVRTHHSPAACGRPRTSGGEGMSSEPTNVATVSAPLLGAQNC